MTVSMPVLSAGDGVRYLMCTVAAGDGDRSRALHPCKDARASRGDGLDSVASVLGRKAEAPGFPIASSRRRLSLLPPPLGVAITLSK